MKTLHLYLTRQTLATVVMTVAVFAFVLLLGNIIKEVFTLLLSEHASLGVLAKAVVLLLPFVLVFALPMGLLTAMLLTFGRLSADQELVAIRGGGISLIALVSPVLLLAVAFTCLSGCINLYLAPKCRSMEKDIVYDLSQIRPGTVLTEGRFVKDISPYIIYVGKIKGEEMHDVLISVLNTNGDVSVNLRASRGVIERTNANSFTLRLFDVNGTMQKEGNWQPLPYAEMCEYPVTIPPKRARSLKLNEMTFWQLREELRELENATAPLPRAATNQVAIASPAPISLTSPIVVQMHYQIAFSFACIGFTLIGIPLGIRSHRKETSVGVAISLILILVYYSFFILAQAFATKSQYYPWLFCWIPNFLFQLVGGFLLWRANRT